MRKPFVCGVIIGEFESAEKAKVYAEKMKNCPHVLFQAVEVDTLCLVCAVPEANRWWLKYPEMNPERAGFKRAKVYVGRKCPSPFIASLKLPRRRAKPAPCGADCRDCDLRNEYKCSGCPAAIFY